MVKVIDKGSYTSKKDGNKRFVYTLNCDGFYFGQFVSKNDIANVGDEVKCNFGMFKDSYYIKSIERSTENG